MGWFSKRRNEDLDAELRSHRAMAAADRVARGETPADAERNARRELGSDALIQEVTREMWGWNALDRLHQDVGYAARVLRRSPGFTTIAVVTLALGIGATTALFSAIEAVLLRPLPYHRPQELLWITRPSPKMPEGVVLTPEFSAWRRESGVFSGLAAWNDQQFNLTRAGEPEQIVAASVNAEFLHVLGVQPFIGRDFELTEDVTGHTPVVLLGYDLWQRHFGGDTTCLGRTVALNDRAFTIVGVLPRGFRFPGPLRAELLVPGGYSAPPDWNAKSVGYLGVFGRPREGVTPAQVRADLEAIELRHIPDLPAFVAPLARGSRIELTPLAQELSGKVRRPLLVLWGAVTMVLLLISTNMAGLQLARASARTGELALRAALGAGRARLFRLLLAESLLVACAGGLLGLAGAHWMVRVLRVLEALRLPTPDTIRVNFSVLLFALLVTLGAGVLAGLAPALTASRPDLQEAMKGSNRAVARGWRGGLRSVLVVAEVAMALVLLLGAGLLLRSVQKLLSVRMGLDPARILTMRLPLWTERYRDEEQRIAFVSELLSRTRTLPSVERAAVITSLPLTNYNLGAMLRFEGQPEPPQGQAPSAAVLAVSPEYFSTFRIPMLAGRGFEESDRRGASAVVIVNATFVNRFYAGQDAVGKRLRVGPSERPWTTIVGVVGDVRHRGPEYPADPEVFVPYGQWANGRVTLSIRSAIQPEPLASAVRREVHALDPDLPLFDIATMEDRVARSTAPQRLELALVGFFAVLATVLAALGVYGVMAYAVSQSRHEIGVRLALGASPGLVERRVVGRGISLGLAGVASGLAGGFALTRYLSALLFETGSHDVVTFVGASVILLVMALLASYLPARRAARIDPIATLRCD
jgi:putative ABC transport system permease protein